jgi:hypothetical protein
MTVNRTTLLDLPLPVTGTESNTWGDITNNGLTEYMDIAIAGMSNLTSANFTAGALTIETTEGNSAGTSITATSAQYAGFRVTSLAANSTITVGNTGTSPARSYRLINADATYNLTFKATGQTGVTLLPGQSAVVAFNGTDYVIVGTVGAGTATDNAVARFDGTTGEILQNSAATIDDTGAATFVGSVNVSGTSASAADLKLYEDTDNGTNYVAFKSPASVASNVTWTLPSADGTNGQALTTNGSGTLAFSSVTTAPGGSNTQVQFNNSGAFGGSSLFTWDGAQIQVNGVSVGRGAGSVSTNTAVGASALATNSTGSLNTAVGWQALLDNTTASGSTAVGYRSLENSTASANTAVGDRALVSNTSGANNTAVGTQALTENTTASNNTAVGYQSLYANTTGGPNDAFGFQALKANTTGNYNVSVGTFSLGVNTTGSSNSALGNYALQANTTGGSNTALGYNALYSNTTASNNTAVGYQAGYGITTGTENTFLGYNAGDSGNGSGIIGIGYQAGRGGGSNSVWIGYNAGQSTSNSGTYNVGIGFYAGVANTSGQGNVFIGYNAGASNTTGTANVFIGGIPGDGTGAGSSNTTGSNNVALGGSALKANTTASSNVAIGWAALYNNTTASGLTAVGYRALYSNTTGGDATAFGYEALTSHTTGGGNSAFGYQALASTSTGQVNTAVGGYAMISNTTGGYNTAVGSQALRTNQTGNYNVAMGREALYSNTASNNTAVGYQTLAAVTTGAQNTAVGYQAGNTITTGQVNTCIGNATASAASGSWQIVIGNQSGTQITGKGDSTGFINPNTGGVYQGNNSSSWSTTSDRRLKKNIVDNNEGLDKISQIRVRNFEYRLPEEVDAELKPQDAIQKTGIQLGVIAQELQEVCPDCVKEESTGVLSVDSDNVFWHMLNAIKQLNTRLQAAEAEIATLKGN